MREYLPRISIQDFEGTVKQAIKMLECYSPDAKIFIAEEPAYIYGGWSEQRKEFLVIEESQNNGRKNS